MLKSVIRTLTLAAHVSLTGVIFFAVFLYVLAHAGLDETDLGPPVEAGTLPVTVYEDREYDGRRFAASRTLGLKTFPARPIIDGFGEFIRGKFAQDGVRVVSQVETEDHLTFIEKKISRSNRRHSPFIFRANRSIDVMFCHDPISTDKDKSWQCQHLIFEFYFENDYDLSPLYREIWRTMHETRPIDLPGTWAYRPMRITILDIKPRL
ncbi:hypothetical protein ACN9MF_12850 [Methylobacterium fujisawaense]|uniref:hypothetical protein n=1 Tax=Methylobacterium fujisawaense TaxID=107400 RepID=UPI003CEF3A36